MSAPEQAPKPCSPSCIVCASEGGPKLCAELLQRSRELTDRSREYRKEEKSRQARKARRSR